MDPVSYKNTTQKVFRQLFIILQVATVCVFLGRAWQHLVWEAPFRALFWDETLMKPFVESFAGMTWEDYVKNPATDEFIQLLIRIFGWIYLGCAIVAAALRRLGRVGDWVLGIGAVGLVFLAALYYLEKFSALSQFLEYSLQFCSPIFLIVLHRLGRVDARLILGMKIATALTFVSHGLYAVGFHPRPGNFTEMVMNILGLGEEGAVRLLLLAGIMDFLVSILIFVPVKRVFQAALLYIVFWGFFTSIARVWAYFYVEFWQETFSQSLHEALYRFPHFLIPFFLFWYYRQAGTKSTKSLPI